ncbi:MAG: DUF1295 domain-containing protein [Verrucomicrobiota bacterium]
MNKETIITLTQTAFVCLLGVAFAFIGSNGYVFKEGLHPFAVAALWSFLVQWVLFIPSFIAKSEKYFDLTGSFTFASATLISIVLSQDLNERSLILASMVIIWSSRLGYFLFNRIRKAGEDGRFEKLKQSPTRFFAAWTLQGLWVVFTTAPAFAAITSSQSKPIGTIAFVGIAVWLVGITIEIVADTQKSRFKADPANKGKFISNGLWALSRHPNYFGEILLWIGVSVVSLQNLVGLQWITLLSPILIAILLIKVSGIPLLEKRADEKWGGEKDYENYKKRTPYLVPWRLSSRSKADMRRHSTT